MACLPGFADCNVDVDDGCEVDVENAASDCGRCANACADAPQGSPVCTGGQCALACEDGFGDCDALYGTGCEADLTADRLHCGACDAPCPVPEHAIAACLPGGCDFVCEEGWGDCNEDGGDGCERHLLTDVGHCGECNDPCPEDTDCSSGFCFACGNGVVDETEEADPAVSPCLGIGVSEETCRFDFSGVTQLYCHGNCSWAGDAPGCDQADADAFCRLRTGNPLSTASDFAVEAPRAEPGFACPTTDVFGCLVAWTLPTRAVHVAVRFEPGSLAAATGGGSAIVDVTCTEP